MLSQFTGTADISVRLQTNKQNLTELIIIKNGVLCQLIAVCEMELCNVISTSGYSNNSH